MFVLWSQSFGICAYVRTRRLKGVVDGKVVNIPSFSVKPGMVVGVREKSKSLEVIEAALAGYNHSKPHCARSNQV